MCNYDIKYNIYNIWLSICVSCIFTLNHHGEQWGLQSIILVSGMSYPSPVMLGSVKTSRLSLSPGLKWSLPPNDPSGVAEQAIRVEPQEMKGIETWWDKPLIIKISYKKCPLKNAITFSITWNPTSMLRNHAKQEPLHGAAVCIDWWLMCL